MKKVMKGIFFKLMFNIMRKINEFQIDLPFLFQRMKTEKVEKHVPNLHDKTEYAIHIKI